MEVIWRYPYLKAEWEMRHGRSLTSAYVHEHTRLARNVLSNLVNGRKFWPTETTAEKLLTFFSRELERPVNFDELVTIRLNRAAWQNGNHAHQPSEIRESLLTEAKERLDRALADPEGETIPLEKALEEMAIHAHR